MLGKLLLWLNVAAALALGGWYLAQPESRQQEVARLVGNAFAQQKRVSPLDVAWDLWQLYYADSAVGAVARVTSPSFTAVCRRPLGW